jgi:hypothetical protein
MFQKRQHAICAIERMRSSGGLKTKQLVVTKVDPDRVAKASSASIGFDFCSWNGSGIEVNHGTVHAPSCGGASDKARARLERDYSLPGDNLQGEMVLEV